MNNVFEMQAKVNLFMIIPELIELIRKLLITEAHLAAGEYQNSKSMSLSPSSVTTIESSLTGFVRVPQQLMQL